MRSRRGAAALEFALTSIVFFTLLFAIFDYGWFFFRRANIQDAVVEGARRGSAIPESSAPGPEAVARDVVETRLSDMGIDPATVDIDISIDGVLPTRTISVAAEMPFENLIAFVPLPTPDTLSATMSMHLEVQ
jgi:Flp pilus assembly protein TadG